MSDFHQLRVASVRNETRDAVVVTFDVPEEQRDAFAFVQGQHLTLRARVDGEELRRSYSICSAPHDNQVRIAIKRVQDGLFSTWANENLRPGHTIECMVPLGNFHVPLDAAASRNHVAFAAGSGITPVLSILKATLAAEPHSRFTLVYGNRASSSVLFKDELEDLKDVYMGRFNLIFILSREQQDIELFNGRIDREKCDALLNKWIDSNDIDVAYICGPQSMMEGVAASLETHGVARDSIKMEYFAATSTRSPRPLRKETVADAVACKVTVIRDGHRREFGMDKGGKTLLDAALDLGIDLPYSCKAGVCSTCRTKMLAGEVDMDVNFALEDYEIARGFILPCQSYPRTSEIVLDYDVES